MFGLVRLSDLLSVNVLRSIANNTYASDLLDDTGSRTGLRVYGDQVARSIENMSCKCGHEGYFRNGQYWRPSSTAEVVALVVDLGYLVIGNIPGTSGHVVIFADFREVVSAWRESLDQRHRVFMSGIGVVEEAVSHADKELDEPF